MKQRAARVGILLALACVAAASQALAAGRLLAAGCMTCHGGAGGDAAAVPALQGAQGAAIASALHDFRAGRRPGTVMPQLAKGYTDADIDAIAVYLAALARP